MEVSKNAPPTVNFFCVLTSYCGYEYTTQDIHSLIIFPKEYGNVIQW